MDSITLQSPDDVSALIQALPAADRRRLVADVTDDGDYVIAVPADLAAAVSAVDLPSARLAVLKAAAVSAIDTHVEATARTRGYNSASACASYIMSTNAIWSAEAEVFVAWRDAVWAAAFSLFGSVQSGAATVPTIETVIAGLPVIQWPET
jgi:hypothetical protein